MATTASGAPQVEMIEVQQEGLKNPRTGEVIYVPTAQRIGSTGGPGPGGPSGSDGSGLRVSGPAVHREKRLQWASGLHRTVRCGNVHLAIRLVAPNNVRAQNHIPWQTREFFQVVISASVSPSTSAR